jgi:hypothetical protein
MKVHLLEKGIESFLETELSKLTDNWYYPHSIVNHFHGIWDHLPERGLKATYEQALYSDISNRCGSGMGIVQRKSCYN